MEAYWVKMRRRVRIGCQCTGRMTLKSRHFSAIVGLDEREHGRVRLGPVLRDPRRRRVRRRAELEQLDDLDPGLQAAGGDAANAPKSELCEKLGKLRRVLCESSLTKSLTEFIHSDKFGFNSRHVNS